jgi:hypothetical protein
MMGATGRVMMLTLTIDRSDPRYADPANREGKARPLDPANPRAIVTSESVRYAAWAWHRFGVYMRREYGAVPYFRGLELTAAGVAHLHVLLRVRDAADFMALRALVRGPENARTRGLAVRAGFGLVVDAQLARSGGDVARYVTKSTTAPGSDAAAYATKGLGPGLPRYSRRASWSRAAASAWAPGWIKPAPLRGFTWRVARASVGTVSDALARSDFALTDPVSLRAAGTPGLAGAGG